jgi:hypothetical protein
MNTFKFDYLYNLNNLELKRVYSSCCINREEDMELLEFLFTNQKLKHNIDINQDDGYPLCDACARGHTNIVKFLLSSPLIEKHADIHSKNDLPFRVLLDSQNTGLLEFFSFEMNFQISERQKKISLSVVNPAKKEYIKHIFSLFDKRDFNEKLTCKIKNLSL